MAARPIVKRKRSTGVFAEDYAAATFAEAHEAQHLRNLSRINSILEPRPAVSGQVLIWLENNLAWLEGKANVSPESDKNLGPQNKWRLLPK